MSKRGFSVAEAETAVREGEWEPAEHGRLSASVDFPFNAIWNRRFYTTKRVRPIFVDEPAEIVIVTVYTYYF